MKITFLNGAQAGEELEFLLSEITIGREDCNILRLSTDGVSRYHASLKLTPDRGWVIFDQNSTNGVKVNGTRIAGEKIVFDGDTLTIGEQELRIDRLSAEPPVIEFQPILTGAAIQTAPPEREVSAAPGTTVSSSVSPSSSHSAAPEPLSGEKLLDELRSAGSGLFSRGTDQNASGASGASAGTAPGKKSGKARPRRPLFNVIFYLALFIAAGAVASLVLKKGKGGPAENVSAPQSTPEFTVYYEKVEYDSSRRLAYRLELRLEQDRLFCTLDDIFSERHITLERKVDQAHRRDVDNLQHALNTSGVFELKNDDSVRAGQKNRRRLTVVSDKKLLDLAFSEDVGANAFDEAEAGIRRFLKSFGLEAAALTRAELEESAKSDFNNAEEAFRNYASDLSQLRDAVRYYSSAIACYEQFQPPHPDLKTARKRLDEVRELQKSKLKELQAEFARCSRMRNPSGMAAACREIMALSEERSTAYREAAEQLSRLRRNLENGGGKQR